MNLPRRTPRTSGARAASAAARLDGFKAHVLTGARLLFLRLTLSEGHPPAVGGWMVKVPFPLHPVPPVRIQVPEIVLPFTVPSSVSTLFVAPGNIVVTVKLNVPVTLPLRFPMKPKVPVSDVWSEAKQGPGDVKEKLVTLSVSPLP
jgi:hypothetical protein